MLLITLPHSRVFLPQVAVAGTRLKAALMAKVYHKALKLPQHQQQETQQQGSQHQQELMDQTGYFTAQGL